MAQQVKLEDSNMANYGSEEHIKMRKDASQKEPAWKDIGKENGVQIWRIEKFQVKHWPKDRYGEFYSGDSYIILHTKENDEGKKEYDVFFWLGAETSQDEAGTAAYKTVELDDYLGDEPVQYREVQGNESKKFLDVFNKMTILQGGVDSGFHKVKPENYKPRLLHVTGYKQHVQVYQVPIKAESLNNCDSYVLDCGLTLFQFNGEKSSAWEKRKANAIIDELQAARHGKVKNTYIIDGIKDKGNPLIEEFWGYFGGRPKEIKDEEEMKEAPEVEPSVHHVSNATGRMVIEEVCRGKLDKKVLNSDDCFIVDVGVSVFIWVGQGSNNLEKREAMNFAVQYLKNQGRDSDVPIGRVSEGKETPEFWAAFAGKPQGGRAANAKDWK
jgi:gelsolin